MLLWKRTLATTIPQITPLRGNYGSAWIQGILMKHWKESLITHTAKLKGMTVFTIVEFKKGYWMMVLHPDSRNLPAWPTLWQITMDQIAHGHSDSQGHFPI